MAISLRNVKQIREISADEVEAIQDNTKYAKLNDVEVKPVVSNVKCA